jgi:hypothetical protein
MCTSPSTHLWHVSRSSIWCTSAPTLSPTTYADHLAEVEAGTSERNGKATSEHLKDVEEAPCYGDSELTKEKLLKDLCEPGDSQDDMIMYYLGVGGTFGAFALVIFYFVCNYGLEKVVEMLCIKIGCMPADDDEDAGGAVAAPDEFVVKNPATCAEESAASADEKGAV